jgi:hypothetical protein
MESELPDGTHGSSLGLRLAVITLLLAYAIYAYTQMRKEYEACAPFESLIHLRHS